MLRKHQIEMSETERKFAEALVHALAAVDTSYDHLQQEMAKDHIPLEAVKLTLRFGSVIEVNSYGRIVVRLMKDTRKYKKSDYSGTCVVVEPKTRRVVTAWYNRPTDKHKTLRLTEYGWNVNVVEYLRQLAA